MKICILTSVHPVFDIRIFQKEAKTLARANYDVSLIAQHDKEEIVDRIKIIPLLKPRNRLYRIFISPWFVFKKALKQKSDVYHFHDPELIPISILLKYFVKNSKIIYDAHEDVSSDILVKNWIKNQKIRKIVSVIFRILEKLSCIFFDQIITVSEPIAKKFPSNKTTIIQNLPIIEKIENISLAKIKKYKPVVIYAGGLNKVRGIKEIIQAIGLMNGKVELWLFGDFKDKNIEKECKNTNGWQNTKYFGYTSQIKLYSYMKGADIGIINFLPMPHNTYGLPNKPFEYMTCSLPVIMSNFPYWQSFFENKVLYCRPDQPSDIAAKINYLLKNSEQRKKMIIECKNMIIKKWNWKTQGDKLIKLYQKLLE